MKCMVADASNVVYSRHTVDRSAQITVYIPAKLVERQHIEQM